MGPIAFVRYEPALHDSQCNVWGEVVVHGKGAGVRSTSIEGGAIQNFCLYKFTNMGYFSRKHPLATHHFPEILPGGAALTTSLTFPKCNTSGTDDEVFP